MESVDVAPEADKSQPQKPSPPDEDQSGDGKDDAKKKATVRKRTKTGCLTCRKRRIKCDENRPFCNNCKKSKRNCEGYNQRLVFKDPVEPYSAQYHGQAGYPDHAAYLRHLAEPSASSSSHGQGSHPLIAPKPPPVGQRDRNYRHGYPTPTASVASPQGFNFNQPFGAPDSLALHQTPAPNLREGLTYPRPPFQEGLSQSPMSAAPASFAAFPPVLPLRPSISEAVQQHERLVAEPYDPEIDVDMESGEEYLGDSEDDEVVEADRRGEERYSAYVVEGRAVAHHEANDAVMRTFAAYAEGKALTTYQPTASKSPLDDPKTLAVFRHFVFVTGPSMSLYERHPFDHSKINPGQPAAEAGQANRNIWTYTFPILSLNHPALLQAMLALGSLQIANLQRVPATAAMKHYHLAIRRIAKNVRDEDKRKHPATLAATLLLSYFEVWSSDHAKWCKHLYGARILFREVDFREKSRRCLPAKRAQRRNRERMQNDLGSLFAGYNQPEASAGDEFDNVDVEILAHLMDQPLSGENYGVGIEIDENDANMPTDREIELYEHQRDLFWWNCKMDVYQSILGGTRLFMRFEDWLPCPPRAPIGRLDAIYGTFDHILLLLGRLSEFVSNDLPRKRKVHRGMMAGGPPGNSPPMFPGMLPTNGKVSAPMGFSPPREPSPQSDNMDDTDLESATRAAMQQWEAIKDAFHMLRSRFGPEFEPLAAEFSDRRKTPFGMTVQYRTYSLAGIWMNYYMGLIHLHRAHPSMPPAAMMAAGRAAKDTAPYAIEIGRIAAGLVDSQVSVINDITILQGAAFIESCFPLFVAGIQFQDNAQRQWLIRMLDDIARLTGWRSARQIAQGCESYWIKAAQLNRGPPYVRTPEVYNSPQSVWTNPRRIDRRFQELDEGGVLVLAPADQANLAMGLLGVDEDLDRLRLSED